MTGRAAAWAQLLRISAVSTVPGDAVVGAVAGGSGPGRGTALAAGASLCLYEAGMALNDWADQEEDARERPQRPLPSGRIQPRAALAAATGLTATGLALAARAGRLPLLTATALATTVWAYDLRLKHTPAGPAAMAAARSLDVLLGAAATERPAAPGTDGTSALPPGPGPAPVLGAAALMGAHTLAVTSVSRREAEGGAPAVPLAALGAVAATTALLARQRAPLTLAACTAYAATAARPLAHAALNPSPPLLQRAVGGGIRAMIPLQAALTARACRSSHPPRARTAGSLSAAALLGLLPVARRLSRKVSPT
ncbi:SCO3242 family prenyltransferase [Streptomyces qinglanensis]|uniref:4-hydroxybenzoate polyprenyltransferase n=1 Tax=Streptomyces qinglanensis TaxID=943816 RepID=A0A1H9S795_9ACTN|nr:UbiA family prenyltransferase [Streptomyces qinglanensis]SER80850.1 4-hydroxybenzoate polyprenyltransferase [Streptomyces qinglanensis]